MDDANRPDYFAIGFWSFALSFVLLPIGLGGDRPVPLGLAQIGMAVSAFCLFLNPQAFCDVPVFPRLRFALFLIAAVLAWAVVQILPVVPSGWTHPLWQETAAVLKKPAAASISIVPEDGLKGLMRLLTYIAGGLLAYIFAQDPRRARQLVTAFWVSGTAICVYGLIIQMTGARTILWFPKWAYVDDLTATFVNHNHFAIYAGMVLIAGFVLMIQSWRAMIRNCRPSERIASIRDWILYRGVPRGTLLAVTLLCIMLSHSRAGLVCSLIGLGAALFFYQVYFRSWLRAVFVGLVFLAVFALVLGVALQVSDRFAVLFNDDSTLQRSKVYEIAWHAIKDNPWLGYGLNGFEPEYRLYQQYMYWEFNHAHSDILESILDLGVAGAAILWAAIAVLLSCLWHGIRHRRQDGMYAILALAASLAVLTHALVDFDLQIPGVVLSWAGLLGIGLAQSWSGAEKKELAEFQ